MNEIIFLVEEADEGGFVARALGASIFTQGDTLRGRPTSRSSRGSYRLYGWVSVRPGTGR